MATSLVKPEVKEQELESRLALLKSRAESLIVRTAEDYELACQGALDGRSYIKGVGFELDPGIEKAKEMLTLLKNQKAKFVCPAELITEIFAKKAEDWKAEERRKAQAEEVRLNAERKREAARVAEEQRKKDEAAAQEAKKLREAQIEEARAAGEIGKREANKLAKQAEEDRLAALALANAQKLVAVAAVQDVKVKPAVPTVAGIRALVLYKFRILNAAIIPRNYLKPDEVAIGIDVRKWKQTGEVIPGVEAYTEDGI